VLARCHSVYSFLIVSKEQFGHFKPLDAKLKSNCAANVHYYQRGPRVNMKCALDRFSLTRYAMLDNLYFPQPYYRGRVASANACCLWPVWEILMTLVPLSRDWSGSAF